MLIELAASVQTQVITRGGKPVTAVLSADVYRLLNGESVQTADLPGGEKPD